MEQKVAWSIAEYLSTLEKSADELLHHEIATKPKPDSKSKPIVETGPKPELNGSVKPEPKREPMHGLEPETSVPKANH